MSLRLVALTLALGLAGCGPQPGPGTKRVQPPPAAAQAPTVPSPTSTPLATDDPHCVAHLGQFKPASPLPAAPARATPPLGDADYTLRMWEMPKSGLVGGTEIWLRIEATQMRECLGYTIDAKIVEKADRWELLLGRTIAPKGACADAIGPATTHLVIPDELIDAPLLVRQKRNVDKYRLVVSPTRLALSPITSSFTALIGHAEMHRPPKGALSLECTFSHHFRDCAERAKREDRTCKAALEDPRLAALPAVARKPGHYSLAYFEHQNACFVEAPDDLTGLAEHLRTAYADRDGCLHLRLWTWDGRGFANPVGNQVHP